MDQRNTRIPSPQNVRSRRQIVRRRRQLFVGAILLTIAAIGLLTWWWGWRRPSLLTNVVTLDQDGAAIRFPIRREAFGLAADEDGNLYVSDGVNGVVRQIPADGGKSNEVGKFVAPSGLAFAPDGTLVVADTGSHSLVRINLKTKQAKLVIGKPNVSGRADGVSTDATFNGPVGVAVGTDGTIFIADTYNDRIRAFGKDGQVRTIAGGDEPGYRDGVGAEARFDTPCGIAVASDGSLLVADTGNHRIRRVTLDGRVATIAGTGEATERDGAPLEAAFDEPTAIAMRDEASFYVADAAGSTVRLVSLVNDAEQKPFVKILAGGFPPGFSDGELANALFNRPTGLAVMADGELAVADSDNGFVRALVPAGSKLGRRVEATSIGIDPNLLRDLLDDRWPFDPPQTRREIAGTFGEVRGEQLPEREAWFHNGLDIPGAYGEQTEAVLTERVTRPLAVEGVGTTRERLRLPLFGYIHVRIGRDQNDKPLDAFPRDAVTFRRDEQGQIVGVRLRRGTLIKAGTSIGTLNRLNHIHLIAGTSGYEFNALAALKLPGLSDAVPPVIESVKLTNESGEPLAETDKRFVISGKFRINARAYDQADGNARYRRLGVYRLGYQLLKANGALALDAPGQIVFDRLPAGSEAVKLVYAEGSQSGYQGVTIFDYRVTNIVRGGEAREAFCDLAAFPPGDYTLRVLAEDFFGNQARRDLPLTKKQ